MIPAKAFEHERQYLTELPPHLLAPYMAHERGTDQYGYVAFAGNYYWVPGGKRDEVKLLEYADRLKIFQQRTCWSSTRCRPTASRVFDQLPSRLQADGNRGLSDREGME